MTDDLRQRIISELEASAELHTFVLILYEQDKISNGPTSKDAKQHLLDNYGKHASACRALMGQLKKESVKPRAYGKRIHAARA
jgi:hypothetical protein